MVYPSAEGNGDSDGKDENDEGHFSGVSDFIAEAESDDDNSDDESGDDDSDDDSEHGLDDDDSVDEDEVNND